MTAERGDTRIKAAVAQTTIDLLGETLGFHLLGNRAILPVQGNKKPAAGIRNFNNGVDLDQFKGPWAGLAIINGERSGVLVVDIDKPDLAPPVSFNVKTEKGGHIWIPWEGERRQRSFAPGVDILGTGGYAIFSGPGKEFISSAFADRATVWDWLSSLSGQSSEDPAPAPGTCTCTSTLACTCTSTSTLKIVGTGNDARAYVQSVVPESENRECVYREKLAALGFDLKVDTITKTYASQMRNTPEGSRNVLCHRYALEVYRCGGDLGTLEQAAIDSGLEPREVRATIAQAKADIDFDYRPETEIYTRVQAWLKAYEDVFFGVMLDVANELAYEAIVTNSTRPLVSQTRTAQNIGHDRPYVGRVIKIMQDRYKAVRIHSNPGTWNNGRTHCHNYELTINGDAI
ncbi:hypothetical protein SAMN05660642_03034 [Geodermatophilus siccatus]|uniref:Bifunctional DNA primase/polymerase, N-terminal n=1 Tax=Geodermatophilus siccatus TaxID=1137991 RepID=A0A1G9V111_9ACTN|nr:hypothetical protein [Geodermatophilus siccatus]SDM65737.1 hypothetical protein SAMN05660642_03034 [Geodermatophilus siccatus]